MDRIRNTGFQWTEGEFFIKLFSSNFSILRFMYGSLTYSFFLKKHIYSSKNKENEEKKTF